MEGSLSIDNLLEILEAEIILDNGWFRDRISHVSASDLMSDILSYSKRKSLLLTGLTNPQTIRTAEMVEIAAICFVHGKVPHKETIELARTNQMPLLKTELAMFGACGRLYESGLQDCNSVK